MALRHPKMHAYIKFGIPACTHQIWDFYLKNCNGYAADMIILKSKSDGQGQSYSDLKILCDTSPSQDAFTHQIKNSYVKGYRRCAPDSIPILETRSEIKVTVNQGWYGTLCYPKMHAHTIFGIPASINIKDMHGKRIADSRN